MCLGLQQVGNSNSNMDLVLDYILSYRVVGNISTYIFICRANHSSLLYSPMAHSLTSHPVM